MSELITETQKFLTEINSYDLASISRTDALGTALSFGDAVEPIKKTRDLLSKIATESLSDLSTGCVGRVHNICGQLLGLLERIRTFDPGQLANASQVRESLINESQGIHETAFENIYPLVAYVSSTNRALSELEEQSRDALKRVGKDSADLRSELSNYQVEAQKILNALRDSSAEIGVSQQAHYFKTEADNHQKASNKWLIATLCAALVLILYSVVSLFLSIHYKPADGYETAQIALSKLLIFSVLAYILFLSSRTLTANRHNVVVNRHRENALLTFNTLAQSSASEDKRDIILTHAAACIFAPQETGYTKANSGSQLSSPNIIEILPKLGHSG